MQFCYSKWWAWEIRGTFAKFVDSPYYSESEFCGGTMTVSFFEVSPVASDALLTTSHPLLENVLQTVDHFEISCLGAPFSWLEKPRNRMGRDLDCMTDVLMGFHGSTFSQPNTEFSSVIFVLTLYNSVLSDWRSRNLNPELQDFKKLFI
jgi:hypothetical protein